LVTMLEFDCTRFRVGLRFFWRVLEQLKFIFLDYGLMDFQRLNRFRTLFSIRIDVENAALWLIYNGFVIIAGLNNILFRLHL